MARSWRRTAVSRGSVAGAHGCAGACGGGVGVVHPGPAWDTWSQARSPVWLWVVFASLPAHSFKPERKMCRGSVCKYGRPGHCAFASSHSGVSVTLPLLPGNESGSEGGNEVIFVLGISEPLTYVCLPLPPAHLSPWARSTAAGAPSAALGSGTHSTTRVTDAPTV